MFDPLYLRQAKLLLRCLPEIKKHACFALKGGTAINLFFRPMPSLSVDIDLTYLPLCTREAALTDIARTMEAIRQDVLKRIAGARVQLARSAASAGKLVVTLDDVHIKIEPDQVLRGSVYRRKRETFAPRLNPFSSCLSRHRPFHWPMSTAANSAPRSTGSTRATCSTCAFSSPTRD